MGVRPKELEERVETLERVILVLLGKTDTNGEYIPAAFERTVFELSDWNQAEDRLTFAVTALDPARRVHKHDSE